MANGESSVLSNLGEIREQFSTDGKVSPSDLAAAFGWEASHVRERKISIGETRLDVGRGYLGVQPAALFAIPTHRDGVDPLHGAALYGYHAAVRWGFLVDDRGLTAFNSHWLQQDRWFTMPTIKWDSLQGEQRFLEAFQPDQLANGEPEKLALARYPLPNLLQPVDDELVERLDAWRDEALKASRVDIGVDEQLQVLFAKLFVLRTIEDRNLAPAVTSLDAAVVSGRVDYDTLGRVFSDAKKYIGSELFDEVNLDILPEHVVSGIICDLYVPRRLPHGNSRYNFAWIDSDILGLAYEKYLSTILHPLPPAPQLDMFNSSYRDVARISVRRAGGVYYTPEYLTKYLSSKCVDEFIKKKGGGAIPHVMDFACGSGSFLVAAIDTMLTRLKRIDPTRNWGKEIIDGGYINGVDVDEKAVTVARLNLWNRLTEELDPLPLPDLSKVIVRGDGLDSSTWRPLVDKYDIILGNPPFLATSRVSNRVDLETVFETAQGRYDYSYLFVEQAIKATEPEGIIGMVVPNRLFRNQNGGNIRNFITAKMDIDTIVDFGSNEVFVGTSAYIGCIVATHQQIMAPPAQVTRVLEVKSLPEQFVAALLLDAEAGAIQNDKEIRAYEAQHPRGSGPWILLSHREKHDQIILSELSEPLDSIAGIFQGIRTGANDVFILQIAADDEQYGAQVLNGLGDAAILERELLQPVVFGAEVRRYQAVDYNKYLLYPYLDGVAISEAELELKYPQTFRYLQGYRDILSARTSIQASGQRWYELVRRRDEEWLRSPKLLIRDLAPETAFAVDPEGSVFIVGGTAVSPQQDDLLFPLLGYLNSRPINMLVRRTTPQFKGSFQKFEPQHLQRIPVLRRLLEDGSFAGQLGELAEKVVYATEPGERAELGDMIDNFVLEAMQAAGIGLLD